MDKKITIIDYGMGNLRSVYNKFKKMNYGCIVTNDKEEIIKSWKLILPGVGHFKKGIENLKNLQLWDILNTKVLVDKTPILGICLGAQLFAKHSEEGDSEGLGWIDADVVKFKVSDKLKYKIPHMGWNNITVKNHNLLDISITSNDQFYFVHSYYIKCFNPTDIWMITTYDYEFISAIRHENIFGTQFHPEKSHDAGFKLLKKFAEL